MDYLFPQVYVDQALVSDAQGCGNIFAGVGPAAIERGLVAAQIGETSVRIHMVNTGEVATALIQTPNRRVACRGTCAIDGVPGTAASIQLTFANIADSMCGALLPTGGAVDVVLGTHCTLIDNGMPIVILRAADFGLTGQEPREVLEADTTLKQRLEAIRLAAGPLMNLGDVTNKSVPKMTLVSDATQGGAINTRSFIPHRSHASIDVFAAIGVATACGMDNGPAADLAHLPKDGRFKIEHPTGTAEVLLHRNYARNLIAGT